MEVKELRVGNWVNYTAHDLNDEGQVYSIEQHGNLGNYVISIDVGSSRYTFTTEQINPTPLTEDWLKKFGFVYERGFWQHTRDKLFCNDSYYNDKGIYFYLGLWNDINATPLRYLKYVHELQNLYFALIGEELTIKEHDTIPNS